MLSDDRPSWRRGIRGPCLDTDYHSNYARLTLDDLFDPRDDSPATHRMPASDWRHGAYIGPTKGVYPARSVVRDGEIGRSPDYDPKEEITYVIHAPEVGRIKIGRTNRMRYRLKELQTGSPVRLKVVATFAIDSGHSEESLHERFKDSREHGEWFSDKILPDLLALAET